MARLKREERGRAVRLPLLVFVSGKPGSGKSTLARRLVGEDALWSPLVSCDPIRNGLRTSGLPSAGSAAIDVFYGTIDYLLGRGVSLIADLSFRHGLDEAQLLARDARCRLVNIHCEASTELAQERFMARQHDRPATQGARRVAAEMASGAFDWAVFEPLDIPVPRLIVDTSAGYTPDLATIIAFCHEQRGVTDA